MDSIEPIILAGSEKITITSERKKTTTTTTEASLSSTKNMSAFIASSKLSFIPIRNDRCHVNYLCDNSNLSAKEQWSSNVHNKIKQIISQEPEYYMKVLGDHFNTTHLIDLWKPNWSSSASFGAMTIKSGKTIECVADNNNMFLYYTTSKIAAKLTKELEISQKKTHVPSKSIDNTHSSSSSLRPSISISSSIIPTNKDNFGKLIESSSSSQMHGNSTIPTPRGRKTGKVTKTSLSKTPSSLTSSLQSESTSSSYAKNHGCAPQILGKDYDGIVHRSWNPDSPNYHWLADNLSFTSTESIQNQLADLAKKSRLDRIKEYKQKRGVSSMINDTSLSSSSSSLINNEAYIMEPFALPRILTCKLPNGSVAYLKFIYTDSPQDCANFIVLKPDDKRSRPDPQRSCEFVEVLSIHPITSGSLALLVGQTFSSLDIAYAHLTCQDKYTAAVRGSYWGAPKNWKHFHDVQRKVSMDFMASHGGFKNPPLMDRVAACRDYLSTKCTRECTDQCKNSTINCKNNHITSIAYLWNNDSQDVNSHDVKKEFRMWRYLCVWFFNDLTVRKKLNYNHSLAESTFLLDKGGNNIDDLIELYKPSIEPQLMWQEKCKYFNFDKIIGIVENINQDHNTTIQNNQDQDDEEEDMDFIHMDKPDIEKLSFNNHITTNNNNNVDTIYNISHDFDSITDFTTFSSEDLDLVNKTFSKDTKILIAWKSKIDHFDCPIESMSIQAIPYTGVARAQLIQLARNFV